jgi:hypothetical protein
MQAGVTHHIVLTDGTDSVGLMSADDMRSFLRQPVARTSLKTASGDTLYSDLEPPYNTLQQADFSGGRAQKDFRDDATKYYDSQAVDTRFKNQCTLGPKVYSGVQAANDTPEYNPGAVTGTFVANMSMLQESVTGSSVVNMHLDTDHRWFQVFVAPYGSDVATLYQVDAYVIGKAGSISSAELNIYECNSTTQDPTSLLQSVGIGTWTATGSGEWKTITLSSALSLTVGNYYAIEVNYEHGTAGTWLQWPLNQARTGYPLPVMLGAAGYARGYSGAFGFRLYFKQVKAAQYYVYTGTGSYNVGHIQVYLKRTGTVSPTVRIETASGGLPSGTLAHANATKTLTSAEVPTSWGWVQVDYTDFSLTKGTGYFIVVSDETNRHFSSQLFWGGDGTGTGYSHVAAKKIGSAAWATDLTTCYYFRINNGRGLTNQAFKFFEYKSQLYLVDSPLEGNDAGKIWMNGDRGACDSNTGALTTLVDATKSWTTDEWAGCIAKITEGPGKGEYRTISSNTATVLTVSDAFTVTHTTTTEYVILGSNKFTDVTPTSGDTIDYPITDALVANGILFLAQSTNEAILAYREYNNAGTWTKGNDDEDPASTDTTAELLLLNKTQIWRAVSNNQVSYATTQAWGTDLTFGTAISVGANDYKVTGMCVYNSEVYIGKEDGLYSIKNDVPERLDIDLQWLTQTNNCRRMKGWGVYLMLPWGDGLERMYGMQVDDMGPNRDKGLPAGRQGQIVDLLSSPGQLYAAIDAGSGGTSSILVNNEMGWHELLRANQSGKRIRAMHLQVIPGGPNRLYFGMGNDVCYIKVPPSTLNPLTYSSYEYEASGEIITSWIDHHLADVDKYYKSLKLVSESLSSTVTITAHYQTDNSTDSDAWTQIGVFNTSPIQEIEFGTYLTGRRIRFKFQLATASSTSTPNLIAWTLESMMRITLKSRWEPIVWLRTGQQLLDGTIDTQTRATMVAQLDAWANSAVPVQMTTCDPVWSNIDVFLEPMPETEKHYQADESGDEADFVNCKGRLILLEA